MGPVQNEFAVVAEAFERVLGKLHDDPHGITVIVCLGAVRIEHNRPIYAS
jgi:hypothetical protein